MSGRAHNQVTCRTPSCTRRARGLANFSATEIADRPESITVGIWFPSCLRLAELGSNVTEPAVNEREEALDAAVG